MRTSAPARYLVIADELERELRAAGLVGGTRAPSTRAIVERWDVAMATASKALAELTRRGLVRPVRGVGTVVTGTAPLPAPDRPLAAAAAGAALSTDRIVEIGVEIADREGIDAVSMRRIASELGAAPMALYRHVGDKDDLVVRMLDRAYAEARLPDPPPPGWRPRIEAAARAFWAVAHAHPWVAPATSMTRPQATPNVLPLAELMLAALSDLGLSHDATMTSYLAVLNYGRGLAMNLDAEAQAEAATGMDNEAWMATQQHQLQNALGAGDYPTFRRFIAQDYDFDLDRVFELGLAALLDGLAGLAARASGQMT